LVTLAFYKSEADNIGKQLKKSYGCAMPDVNMSCYSSDKKHRFLRVAKDQLFCTCAYDGEYPLATLAGFADLAQAEQCYLTDLSNGFRMIHIKGDDVLESLRYLCMIDVAGMEINSATRTIIEHTGCYIIKNDTQDFTLLLPSSFCHL
nr:hypothetical protein [Alphaproteobacteria bacterium]